ncbi:hypothetical protein SMICM17S_06467 [Streptomyces microflavus]
MCGAGPRRRWRRESAGSARAPGTYGWRRALRRRTGRRGPADGGAGARIPGQQGGLVRGRRAARRAVARRAVRRPGPRQVDSAQAAARRLHPGEADRRLPRGDRRRQPGPAGPCGRARLGVRAVLGVRHGRADRGQDRLLHLDVGPLPGPLRALDQTADGPAHPPPGRPAARPGRQVLVCLHAPYAGAAGAGLARAPRQAVARDPPAAGEGARGRLPDRLPARRRGARGLALPGQRPRPAGQAARRRLRPRAGPAHHADRRLLPLRAALRRPGAVGPPPGAPVAAGQALGAAHPARPAGRVDR